MKRSGSLFEDEQIIKLWAYYTYPRILYTPSLYMSALPPEEWQLELWKNSLDLLIRIIKVCVKEWYDDLMQDDARQRFALLELD